MKIAKELLLIFCFNLLALVLICVLAKLFFGDGPAFILIFIFGFFFNLVVSLPNLISLIWPKSKWFVFVISVFWAIISFDLYSNETNLLLALLVVNQFVFRQITERRKAKTL